MTEFAQETVPCTPANGLSGDEAHEGCTLVVCRRVEDNTVVWVTHQRDDLGAPPDTAQVQVMVDPAALDAARAAAASATTVAATRAALVRLVDALTPTDSA